MCGLGSGLQKTQATTRPDRLFRQKSFSDELFLHFSSKVQNLIVFSIIYMIRIRFLGLVELNQKTFSGHGMWSGEWLTKTHATTRPDRLWPDICSGMSRAARRMVFSF